MIIDKEELLKGVCSIKTGVCNISKISANGKDQIIYFLKEASLLGIRRIFNEVTTNLNTEALTPVEVCFIEKTFF